MAGFSPCLERARTFFPASRCSFPLSVGLIHHFSAYPSSKWWTIHVGWWVFVGGEGGNGRERTKKKKFISNPKDLHEINTFWQNCWMCCWWDSRVSVHGSQGHPACFYHEVFELRGPRSMAYWKAKERLISLWRINWNEKFVPKHVLRPVYPLTEKPVWQKLSILVYKVLWLPPVELLWS